MTRVATLLYYELAAGGVTEGVGRRRIHRNSLSFQPQRLYPRLHFAYIAPKSLSFHRSRRVQHHLEQGSQRVQRPSLYLLPAFTLQLDHDTYAIEVTDSKVRARDLFLGKDELPSPGGPNPLKEAWENNYALELFYFPSSSLKLELKNIFRSEQAAWGI